jgi:hypothetical protein
MAAKDLKQGQQAGGGDMAATGADPKSETRDSSGTRLQLGFIEN